MPSGDDDDAVERHRETTQVREVYDAIATHFSKTRKHAWPEVQTFLEGCSAGGRGLDIGCGNGRHMAVLREKADSVVGVDLSHNLLVEASDRSERDGWCGDLVQADAAALPIASSAVDIAVYVATLHHLPGRAERRQSLDELARVLRAGGRALVSAWSTAHDRFDATADQAEGFDTIVDWTLPGGETVPRFYHIYAPAEFDADLAASDLTVLDSYVSSGNCYAEVSAPAGDGEGKRP